MTGRQRASFREGMCFAALGLGSMVVLGIVSSVIVARIYGVEAIGEYALVLAPSGALATLSSVREQAGLVRELSVLEARTPRVTGLFIAVLAFSVGLTLFVAALVAGITYLLLAGPVGRPGLFAPALALVISFVVIQNTCWNLDMVFSSFRGGRQLFWIRLMQALSFTALAVGVGLVWATVWGLVLATIGSFLTALIHRLVCVGGFMTASVSRVDIRNGFRTLPELIRFGLKIAPGSVADGIGKEAATWVLGALVPIAAVGAYNLAWMLARRLIDQSSQVTEMLFPTLVRRRSGDQEAFDRALVDSMRYAAVAMLLPAAVGGGAAHAVMDVFGPGFSVAAGALAFLLILPAVAILAAILGIALYSLDRPLTTALLTIVRTVVVIGLTVGLTLLLGLTGAAAAIVAGYVIELALLAWVMRGHLERPLHRQWGGRQLVATVLAYVVGFGFARVVDVQVSGVTGLVAALGGGSMVYAAAFLVAGGMKTRDWERAAPVLARVFGRRWRFAHASSSP